MTASLNLFKRCHKNSLQIFKLIDKPYCRNVQVLQAPVIKLKQINRMLFTRGALMNENKTTSSDGKDGKKAGQLAKVFAEYGTTAVVFHTTISLTSLGISYMAVSSGIDVAGLLQKYNLITEGTLQGGIAGGATTFVIAYACHKVFMPVRIFCTVTCTPIIVKKLRQMGWLKNVVKK